MKKAAPIGTGFSPSWFETRSDDRSYTAFHAPMDADEHVVQQAMLSHTRNRVRFSESYWFVLLISIIGTVGILVSSKG
jgi:hypothetical protein